VSRFIIQKYDSRYCLVMKTAFSETWNCYSKVIKVKMALIKRFGVHVC